MGGRPGAAAGGVGHPERSGRQAAGHVRGESAGLRSVAAAATAMPDSVRNEPVSARAKVRVWTVSSLWKGCHEAVLHGLQTAFDPGLELIEVVFRGDVHPAKRVRD